MMVKTLNLKKNVRAGGKKYLSMVKKMFVPYPRAWSKKSSSLLLAKASASSAR
jgi:hypothetical protein